VEIIDVDPLDGAEMDAFEFVGTNAGAALES